MKAQQGSGHGWVFPNADGIKARCGGPGLCSACQEDQRALDMARRLGQETLANQYIDPYAVTAQLLEAMKGQLLIVLVNRLGGNVDLPVAEIDATGQWMLNMSVDQAKGVFTFKTQKKS